MLATEKARGKVCALAFLTSSGGRFYMTGALAVPPLSVKNRGGAVHRLCATNQKNTVC